MNILDTHIHKLRFKIDKDAPPEYKKGGTILRKVVKKGIMKILFNK